MNINQQLDKIWSQDYIKSLPSEIQRGYCFSENVEKKTFLITGFNPSFRIGEPLGNTSFALDFFDNSHDNYFSPIKKMLFDGETGIDIRSETAYADLFYFREQDQSFLQKQILPTANGIRFVAEQVSLTQHIIENIIQPKVIVVKNKESWAYWGKLYEQFGWVWMGYKFEFIQNMECGELYRIIGFIDSNERISQDITETNLKGTFVLFSQHINQYTAKEKRPTAQQLFGIGLWAQGEKMTKDFGI